MEDAMPQRILILDRSLLALNVFRVLFSHLDVAITGAKRLEEIPEHLLAPGKCSLIVVNSNCFEKNFNRYLDFFCDYKGTAHTPKIFLCRES